MPAAQIGRLIQKISRQSMSISTPPTSGPIASASAETAAQMPSAWPCCSTGKAWLTIASESESIAAPPGALDCPCRDQHGIVGGEGREHRAGAEDRHPDQEDQAPAVDVPEPPRRHHQ